jgi:hypothetical protein
MSDEGKPLLPSELVKAHVAGGGFENDEVIMKAAEAFFPERYAPEPKPSESGSIPFGWVRDVSVAKYEEASKDPDFEKVRQRMISTLNAEDAEAANSDFDSFNFFYSASKEQLRQESEERVARSVESAKAQLKEKERQKKIMGNIGNGDFRTMDAAAKLAERFFEVNPQ